MDAKQAFFEKQLQLFMSQDPEEGNFDVIFEIDGKKLYADKFRLGAVSETFQKMLSKRWNSKDEPIIIERFTFDNFKDFITFIYSGECNLTPENIFQLVDISEYYNVEILKNICDEYLSKMEHSNENIFHLMDVANTYSLVKLKQTSFAHFQKNFEFLTASDKFLSFDKTIIKDLIIFLKYKMKPEDIFEKVCKWGEYQTELKKSASDDNENFDSNEALKNEMKEFLPHIQFRKMKLDFLHKFVVLKAFCFQSLKELSDILCNPEVTVKATGPNGEILQGTLSSNDDVVEIIKSLKNIPSEPYSSWNANFNVPSTPSRLKIKNEVKWYLVYRNYKNRFLKNLLGIMHHDHLVTDDHRDDKVLTGSNPSWHHVKLDVKDYIFAEMYGETDITLSADWKIEIV